MGQMKHIISVPTLHSDLLEMIIMWTHCHFSIIFIFYLSFQNIVGNSRTLCKLCQFHSHTTQCSSEKEYEEYQFALPVVCTIDTSSIKKARAAQVTNLDCCYTFLQFATARCWFAMAGGGDFAFEIEVFSDYEIFFFIDQQIR